MIGVVVPIHNEAARLRACLGAIAAAAAHPALAGEAVRVVAVLDCCDDASASIARACGADSVVVDARNVGRARAAGAGQALEAGARWLAFTDADTRVYPDWLAAQLALAAEADAVCGTVTVEDWSAHGWHAQALAERFARRYQARDGHRHIHGANLGASAAAYRMAGGFAPLACSEDVTLVEALKACGARIAWSAAPRVATSARTDARCRGGFGDTLLALGGELAAAASGGPPPRPLVS
ncbi:glycosyltransferase [Xylophilus sp.]|uniref:glycosyltransferase n=1 Tax=Xylophilus sp. TaxID=2653893 RepID=UPI0013B640F5|nr:glycosyltransferase [Xylophilus sp.]KAF1049868.1 MAG: hypothetical protein GAK38_00532 [Xylophilus sp.]